MKLHQKRFGSFAIFQNKPKMVKSSYL